MKKRLSSTVIALLILMQGMGSMKIPSLAVHEDEEGVNELVETSEYNENDEDVVQVQNFSYNSSFDVQNVASDESSSSPEKDYDVYSCSEEWTGTVSEWITLTPEFEYPPDEDIVDSQEDDYFLESGEESEFIYEKKGFSLKEAIKDGRVNRGLLDGAIPINGLNDGVLQISNLSDGEWYEPSDLPTKIKWNKVPGAVKYYVTVVKVVSKNGNNEVTTDIIRNKETTTNSYDFPALGTTDGLYKIWVGSVSNSNTPANQAENGNIVYINIVGYNSPKLTAPSISKSYKEIGNSRFYTGSYSKKISNNSGYTLKWQDEYSGKYSIKIIALSGTPNYSNPNVSESSVHTFYSSTSYSGTSYPISQSELQTYAGKWVKVFIQANDGIGGTSYPGYYYFQIDGTSTSSLTLSKSSWSPGYNADSTTVTVTCSGSYSVSVDAETGPYKGSSEPVEWLTYTKSGSTLTLKVRKNYADRARKGTVTVSSGGETKLIYVTQGYGAAAPTLMLGISDESNDYEATTWYNDGDLYEYGILYGWDVLYLKTKMKNVQRIYVDYNNSGLHSAALEDGTPNPNGTIYDDGFVFVQLSTGELFSSFNRRINTNPSPGIYTIRVTVSNSDATNANGEGDDWSIKKTVSLRVKITGKSTSGDGGSTNVVENIRNLIKNNYKKALTQYRKDANGGKKEGDVGYKYSFSGMCGRCTGDQLYQLGIKKTGSLPNGKDCYDWIKNNPSAFNVPIKMYPAPDNITKKQALLNVLNEANNSTGEPTYIAIMFEKGSQNPEGGQKYGHILLIYSVYKGTVYYAECWNPSISQPTIDQVTEYNCMSRTIEGFADYYSPRTVNGKTVYTYMGAAWFGNVNRTVTYDGTNWENGTPTTKQFTYKDGEVITIKSASELGITNGNRKFLGWAESADPTNPKYQPGQSFTVTRNKCFYAVWQDVSTVRLSGKIRSFFQKSDPVTITITDSSGKQIVSQNFTGSGSTGKVIVNHTDINYSFDLPSGSYTMTVKKAYHAKRTYDLIIGSSNQELNIEIHPLGDFGGDSMLGVFDYGRIYSAYKKKITLSGYEVSIADLNQDGRITALDYLWAKQHYWKQIDLHGGR